MAIASALMIIQSMKISYSVMAHSQVVVHMKNQKPPLNSITTTPMSIHVHMLFSIAMTLP
jgi:hypothetical protein